MLIYTYQDLLASVPLGPSSALPSLTSTPLSLGLPSHGARPPQQRCQKEELRHILLGSPEVIRQTIHQLHVLNYAESLLWSPISTVGEQLVITRAQGEAMSLLRRSL